jgi:hypothetical protein
MAPWPPPPPLAHAGRSPDRLAARSGLQELAAAGSRGREWRLIEVDATLADVDAARRVTFSRVLQGFRVLARSVVYLNQFLNPRYLNLNPGSHFGAPGAESGNHAEGQPGRQIASQGRGAARWEV